MPPLQEIIFEIMRALAPQILTFIKEEFHRTGILPSAEQLDAALITKRDEAIAKGEDWLATHKE